MNSIFYHWLMPSVLRFTATRRHTMDDLAFGSGALSDRCRRQQLRDLVPGFDEDPDDPSWPDLPPEPIVPTPTDVPVPDEFDAPFPEPMSTPPNPATYHRHNGSDGHLTPNRATFPDARAADGLIVPPRRPSRRARSA